MQLLEKIEASSSEQISSLKMVRGIIATKWTFWSSEVSEWEILILFNAFQGFA